MVRNRFKKAKHSHIGRRVAAVFLALSIAFGLVNWTSSPAIADDESYQQELKVRQDEYAKKFDLQNLLWSTTHHQDGATVAYGNSARNYLYWAADSFGGVAYKNYIHVYAFEGDTICFGSNVSNSQINAVGNGNANQADWDDIHKRLGNNATVDIVMTDLRGNRILYDVVENGRGHIPNVQTEVLAKTMEDPEGNNAAKLKAAGLDVGNNLDSYTYTPLTYKVTETGVYTFEFHSFYYTNDVGKHRGHQGNKNNNTDAAWKTTAFKDNDNSALVTAWDISVFNEQGHKETGRVYADYLSLQQSGSYNVVESYYVVTTDSYIYRWDWNGNRPNTYNFFADNKGLTDNATGSTLYKSVKELHNTSGFDYTRFGASFKYPGSANTDESKSYYIFFEKPNPDLEGHLYSKAIQPDPAENIRFVDTIKDDNGNTVPGSYVGMGGYFAFDTKEATTATLVLDFEKLKINNEPANATYAPVTISGPVKPYSTNYFYWDGKDGNGKVIPEGTYNIKDVLTLTTKAGEIHFPVHDMEYAPGGFTFTRVSPIYNRDGEVVDAEGTILNETKNVIYYDDTAIYYGEKVGRTGISEEGVGPESGTETFRTKYRERVVEDNARGNYYKYNNMRDDSGSANGGEYVVRDALRNYVGGVTAKDGSVDAADFIRIGDHSHTTNLIEYYNAEGRFLKNGDREYENQKDKIRYLNSSEFPVAKIPTWTINNINKSPLAVSRSIPIRKFS